MDKKYKIGGMTCSACANRVERGIKKMEGMKVLVLILLQKH